MLRPDSHPSQSLTIRSFITQPNMYARGILFGKMKYELGDHAVVRSPELGLEADVEFKVKGWVGGTYNAIGGFIKDSRTNKNLYELSGLWTGEMYAKDLSTGKKELLFDAANAKPSYPQSRPLEEQAPRESQRLWDDTTRAIKKSDHRGATDAKSAIEEEQRREAAERGGEDNWKPKLFVPVPAGDEEKLDWIIEAHVDSKAPPKEQIEQILAIAPILPGQKAGQQQTMSAQQAPPPPYQAQQQPSQGTAQQPLSAQPVGPQPLPSQQPLAGPQPLSSQQQRGGNDLIDFGQHDGATDMKAINSGMANLSAVSTGNSTGSGSKGLSTGGRGNRVVRTDSMGNEEAFEDAET
jgi:hypothetical protein